MFGLFRSKYCKLSDSRLSWNELFMWTNLFIDGLAHLTRNCLSLEQRAFNLFDSLILLVIFTPFEHNTSEGVKNRAKMNDKWQTIQHRIHLTPLWQSQRSICGRERSPWPTKYSGWDVLEINSHMSELGRDCYPGSLAEQIKEEIGEMVNRERNVVYMEECWQVLAVVCPVNRRNETVLQMLIEK